MVGKDMHVATINVGTEGTECMEDGEELLFMNWVVALGRG